MNTWQERARATMRKKELTQRDVAEKMHRAQSTLACWLNGRNKPNLDDIDQLAAALGVDAAWLAYGIESRADPITGRILDILKELPEAEGKKLADVFEALKGSLKA